MIQRKFALDQDNQILHDKDEDDIEPGPRSNAGASTMSDAGLTGGGVLSRGKVRQIQLGRSRSQPKSKE